MSQDVLVDVDGAVATVTFARPDLGNAVTPESAAALLDALRTLDADRAVRVVVLTGSGASFNVGAVRRPAAGSGGAGQGADPSADPVARYRAQIPVMLGVIDILTRSRLVSIAAINGGCAGAGLALALACDLRYAASSARFNSAFLTAGLSGELGAIWLAVRLIGLGRARELFLLPGKVDAPTLAGMGLLNGVVEAAELAATVSTVAQRLLTAPAVAVDAMKTNFRLALTQPFDDYLDGELTGMIQCLHALRDAEDPASPAIDRSES